MKRVFIAFLMMCLFSPVVFAEDCSSSSVELEAVAATAVGKTAYTATALYGSSGSAIMTSMVGAPAIAGVGGAGAAYVLNKEVFNGDTKADEMARKATVVGAAVGTAASVGTLAAVGAGPAGLAAIGSAVGGGMAAGGMLVLAAPAVAASALGYGIYWLFN